MSFTTTVAVAATVAFFGALVQGFSGFGVGIFCMSILSLLLPLRHVDQIVFVTALIAVWSLFIRLGRQAEWKRLPWVLIGMVAGVPIGVSLGPVIPETLGKRILGLIVVSVSVARLWADRQERSPLATKPGPLELLVGAAGGVLGGWVNMSGPPLVYWAHRRLPPLRARATLAGAFATTSLLKLVSLTAGGLWIRESVLVGLCAMPLTVLGAWAGDRLARRTRPRLFARVIWLIFLGLGVLLFVAGPSAAKAG